jgi:hypothetical protein
MAPANPFAKPTRMLRDFSGQVAISIAASAVAAAFFALPDAVLSVRPAPAVAPSTTWSVPLTSDGKFAARLEVQDEPARLALASGPATPAALAMPLAIEWSVALSAPESPVAVRPLPQTHQQRIAHAELPPIRRVATVERVRPEPAGQPLVIAEVAASDQDGRPRPPGLIGRVVAEPAPRAAGLVTGAAGVVGAAGSWTVAQAASLLPRW